MAMPTSLFRKGCAVSSGEEVPVDVFVGLDVGKADHHAVALSARGEVLLDRTLPQDERALSRWLLG